MLKLQSAFIAIPFLLCTTAHAQAVKLSGRVVDAKDQPVANATVSLYDISVSIGDDRKATTDAEGRFEFDQLDQLTLAASDCGLSVRMGRSAVWHGR